MVLKSILKLNTAGSLGICLPAAMMRKLGIEAGDYVNLNVVGNTIHITKVMIE